MFQNLKTLFSSWKYVISYIVLVFCAFWIWWNFIDIENMLGNYREVHTYIDVSLSVIMVLGFPLFIIALVYRGWKFGKKENLNTKTGVWFVSWVIWTIISGSSCCGLTLASYFWLLPLMNFLPYDGLEIKIVWVIGLLYALWSILSELDTCKIKKA